MAPRSRSRVIRYGGELAGSGNTGDLFVPAFNGTHLCVDETHPGPPYNSGGPLLVKKKQILIHRFHRLSAYRSVLAFYSGIMGVRPYIPGVEPAPLSLVGWGAKGWARTQPLHPIYSLGVSLAELRDLPRMLAQTKAGLASLFRHFAGLKPPARTVGELLKKVREGSQNTGDAYLYGAFGLVPMIKDAMFLLEMQRKLDRKVDWLRRHNRRYVRRKVELDSQSYSENIARSQAPSSSLWPGLASQLYVAGMTTSVSMPVLKTYKRRIWYSAKYRYYIPELATDPRKKPPRRLILSLLGLTPDPGTIYQSMPWSWLLDWFTSVGSALSNVWSRLAFHVTAKYAYVMCSEHFTYESPGWCTVNTGTYSGGVWSGAPRSMLGSSKTKYVLLQREEANPFGFGITFSSLSGYQWSILAALGLSRGSKHSAPRP
jgi:hypothetical protein